MQALVIVPTYNERENLVRLVPDVLNAAPVDLLIVDDNSPDGTGDLAEEMALQSGGRMHVMHRTGKLGLGTAYLAGFRWGIQRAYDLLFEMDADFSHNPKDLPRFVEAAQDADVVLGSRYVPGGATPDWPWRRRMLSRGGSLYARTVLGLPYRDLTGGFKCFRRRSLQAIDLNGVRTNGYGFQIEMTWRCHNAGLRIREIPIVFNDRVLGQSKMSGRIVTEAMTMVWQLRRDRRSARPDERKAAA